jgi:uncharacterized protein (DUF2235 family)
MKRIVICCDGTWNTPDKTKQGVPLHTNVVKVAQAVQPIADDGVQQRLYYDPGVGTTGNVIRRSFDGATGSGLSANVRAAYQFLTNTYVPGDALYFFGFSRGAFTVRSLAGLIRNCGILRPDAAHMLDKAYALYRAGGRASHPREKESTLFRLTYAYTDIVPIEFIGVWDTVGALGNPLLLDRSLFSRRQEFHDTCLSSTVRHAYQALAIDEKRRHFTATLWHQQAGVEQQVLDQQWFVGVHANVGGGYPSTGLSDIALEWMAEKARTCHLTLASMEARPDPMTPTEESRTGAYRLMPAHHRPIDLADPKDGLTHESLHPSVLARYRDDPDYRPPNLEDYFARFPANRPG